LLTFARRNTITFNMKFVSTAAVLGFLVTIGFMSNVAVAVPVESSSDGAPARLVERQFGGLLGGFGLGESETSSS
ncbi:hypothetical protein AX14_004963, partial [Amanita brunnescens Koide BX004]